MIKVVRKRLNKLGEAISSRFFLFEIIHRFLL